MTSVDAAALNDPCSDDDIIEDQEEINSSSDEEVQVNNSAGSDNSVRSNSLWFRTRKRLVGHVINRQSIKSVAGVNTYNILQELRKLMKLHLKSKEQVNKIYQALLKTIGKLAVVAQERKLTTEDQTYGQEIKKQCRTITLTCRSFAETEHTYNRTHLVDLMRQCKQTIIVAAQSYLSQRSINRIEFLFNSFTDPEFLDSVFSPQATKEQKKSLNQLIQNFEVVLAEHSV